MGNPTQHDMAGIDLVVNKLRVGATTPGAQGTELSGSEITVLDSVTAGTVAASKAVVVDASSDVTGFRHVTATGTVQAEQLTSTDDATITGTVTAGSLQRSGAVAVTADAATPPTLGFDAGIYAVSNQTDANDWVLLPTQTAADLGKSIRCYAVEGFEVRSADASAQLNNVTIGATNEAAIAADAYVEFISVADNEWKAIYIITDGTPTQLVPDAA